MTNRVLKAAIPALLLCLFIVWGALTSLTYAVPVPDGRDAYDQEVFQRCIFGGDGSFFQCQAESYVCLCSSQDVCIGCEAP